MVTGLSSQYWPAQAPTCQVSSITATPAFIRGGVTPAAPSLPPPQAASSTAISTRAEMKRPFVVMDHPRDDPTHPTDRRLHAVSAEPPHPTVRIEDRATAPPRSGRPRLRYRRPPLRPAAKGRRKTAQAAAA